MLHIHRKTYLCAPHTLLWKRLNLTCERPGLSSAVISSTDYDHPQGSSKWSRWQTNSLQGGKIKEFCWIFINYLG